MKFTLLTALAASFLAATSMAQATEKIYVSNCGSNSITELNSDGTFSTFVAPTPCNPGGPTGLAIDKEGNVYAASNTWWGGTKISEYSKEGTLLGKVGSLCSGSKALTVDDQGNVFVATRNGKIVEIKKDGTVQTVASKLCSPNALAFDSNGNLFVTSGKSDSITEISRCGRTSTVTFTGAPLSDPSGIAIDTSGNIFVINSCGSNGPSIEEISGGIGKIFTTEGLKLPKSIAVDKEGNVFVTNFCSNSVTEYNSLGKLVNTFNGGFNGPCGIVIIDDGGGCVSPPCNPPPVVPEPSTYAMLLGSLGVFYFLHRRKLAKAKV